MVRTIYSFVLIFALLTCAVQSWAVVKTAKTGLSLPEIFGSHMVLQRGQPTNVWGIGNVNQQIEVFFIAGVYKTTADQAGRWKVELPPMKAGGPFSMEVIAGNEAIKFEDVYVGEVWLASGQSNMAFRFKFSHDPEKEALTAGVEEYNIRLYDVGKIVEGGKLLDRPDKPWARATQQSVGEWSAVAFYFARGLYLHLDVPIGIINCSQGASRIEAWMAPASLKSVDVSEVRFDGIQGNYKNPSVLYESMLSKVIPYSVKGVIWYQGESNSHEPESYAKLFPALIRQCRMDWAQPDLPVLFAQLPNYQQPGDDEGESWALFRNAQQQIAASVPHTAMVVLIDAGDRNDIHPTNKRVVGERLVLASRAVAYKENVGYSGPVMKSVRYKGKYAVVSYNHAENGLIIKGQALTGFYVSGMGGKWYPAQASVKNGKVVLYHPEVDKISAVKYGWANAPSVNLYNTEGLPAAPFKD